MNKKDALLAAQLFCAEQNRKFQELMKSKLEKIKKNKKVLLLVSSLKSNHETFALVVHQNVYKLCYDGLPATVQIRRHNMPQEDVSLDSYGLPIRFPDETDFLAFSEFLYSFWPAGSMHIVTRSAPHGSEDYEDERSVIFDTLDDFERWVCQRYAYQYRLNEFRYRDEASLFGSFSYDRKELTKTFYYSGFFSNGGCVCASCNAAYDTVCEITIITQKRETALVPTWYE